MSDFIKVNIKNGDFIILHKTNVCIFTLKGDFLVSLNFMHGQDLAGYIITEEDYDRICKELGVKDAVL